MIRPQPINNEIVLDPSKTIMSKTDTKGIIEYANDYFMEISGYKEWELMGQPHNVIRHPDMPKIIFKFLWERLKEGQPIIAIVKNLAKDGSYYWVIADFETKYDNQGNIIAYYARRKALPEIAKAEISNFYKLLLELERESGVEAAGLFLENYLEEHDTDYDQFVLDTIGLKEDELKQYMFAEIPMESENGTIIAEDYIKSNVKKKGFLKKLFS